LQREEWEKGYFAGVSQQILQPRLALFHHQPSLSLSSSRGDGDAAIVAV